MPVRRRRRRSTMGSSVRWSSQWIEPRRSRRSSGARPSQWIQPRRARESSLGLELVTEEEAAPAMASKPCTRPRRLHKVCSALPDPRRRALRPPLPPSLHARRVAALPVTMATMF
ncbi:uncharacterized protein LOC119301353 [Triticum dicoccoides]|uniref:uncharacterized protein LOC119301353 n=1 Tax=Triticum dicoccoides TaxID=85692 RepID=UPI00188FD087|nr:uncharacterized protein LOC119301353 [Triticum dicoccoides]XP_044381102.1 uncharacterized protein LOC123103549 [Triticum aestivum]